MSEVLLSEALQDNDNKRIDAEYFKKEFLHFFKNIPNLKKLSDFVKNGYRVVYENTKVIEKEVAIEKHYPVFLQATDLSTPFIRTDNLSYVDNHDWERYVKGRVQTGEILIEVKGKVEKVAIVPNDFPSKTLVSGSLYKMTVNSKISKYVLLTYLISKYGTAFKNRYKTNLLISFISKSDLYRIPVPEFSSDLQKQIDEIFINIFKYQKQSGILYQEAETLLLENMGLQNFQAACDPVNIKSLKESFLQTGRLDAEFYQVKYEQYWNLIQSQDYILIGDEYDHITNKPSWGKSQYKYIEIGDVNIGDGSYQSNWIDKQDLPANAKIQVKRGDVLVSTVRPYRGAVTIIHDDDLIVSGAFTVLRQKPQSHFNSAVLKVLLRSELYKDWLLQFNVGTSYPIIKDADILNLPIPKIAPAIQTQIAEYLQKSQALRRRAAELLAKAKNSVEHEIENIQLNQENAG